MSNLREYQMNAFDRARLLQVKGIKRILFVAPTGAGKTVMICWLINRLNINQKKVLLVLPNDIILEQFCSRLSDYSIIKGKKYEDSLLHLGLFQTLRSRELKQYDYVIFDEVHHIQAKSYQPILKSQNNANFFGFSATPNISTSEYFEEIIEVAKVSELIDKGFLVPGLHFGALEIPDLSGVHILGGEYKRDELNSALNTTKINASVVETWLSKAKGLPTIFFGCSVEHSKVICKEIEKAGFKSAHLDGSIKGADRRSIVEGFRTGRIVFLGNYRIFGEGFDVPGVRCISDAQPTLSVALQRQKWGRGMRSEEGKKHFINLDHANNLSRHSFPEEDIDWNFKQKRIEKNLVARCDNCLALFPAGTKICICGNILKGVILCNDGSKPVTVIEREVSLVEISKEAYKSEKTLFQICLEIERRRFPGSQIVGKWASGIVSLFKRGRLNDQEILKEIYDKTS